MSKHRNKHEIQYATAINEAKGLTVGKNYFVRNNSKGILEALNDDGIWKWYHEKDFKVKEEE